MEVSGKQSNDKKKKKLEVEVGRLLASCRMLAVSEKSRNPHRKQCIPENVLKDRGMMMTSYGGKEQQQQKFEEEFFTFIC